MSVRLSVIPHRIKWTSTGRVFFKFDVLSIFQKYFEEIKDPLNMIRITDTLHEDQYTFLIIFRSFPLRMRNVSENILEKIRTQILYSLTFLKIVPFMR